MDLTDVSQRSRSWHLPTAAAIGLSFLIALLLRTYFVFDLCFTGDYVNFQGTDPWYHVRAVDHLIQNFPRRIGWDPYALHPNGQYVAVAPLFDLLLAAIALLAGLGAPSPGLTHAICAWAPAVLGALLTVPCYFLGSRLLDRTAGVVAAAFIAVIPGPFLKRSLLGYADHHVAEALFAAVAVLWLLKAMGSDGRAAVRPTFKADASIREKQRAWLNIAVAALALAVYLLSWIGGALLVFIVFCALIVYLAIGHLHRKIVQHEVLRGACVFAVAVPFIVLFKNTPGTQHQLIALIGGAIALWICAVLSRKMNARRLPRWLFPVGLLTICGTGIMVFSFVAPDLFKSLRGDVIRFVGGEAGRLVIEAEPLFSKAGLQDIGAIWDMFGIGGICLFGALPILGWNVVRRGHRAHTIILVWTLLIGLLTLRQNRFGYYLAVNVALLTGFFFSAIVARCERRVGQWEPRYARWPRVTGMMLVGLVVWLPSIPTSLAGALTHTGPSRDWHTALRWLGEHTEEPFARRDHYVGDYESQEKEPAKYGVMCWWDYGYWVTAIARRVPVANPTQSGAGTAAQFFTAQDEVQANAILDELGVGYVVTDGTMVTWETDDPRRRLGKFRSIARWAGHESSKYYETFLLPNNGGPPELVTLYYPEYYRTMIARLYAFDGRAVDPESGTLAVRFSDISDKSGNRMKRVEETIQFSTYAAAKAYLGGRPTDNWRIVGLSPLETCVPLQALRHYSSVFESASALIPDSVDRARVKVFQYTDRSALKTSD